MTRKELPAVPGGEVIVYQSPDGEGRVDVRFDQESVWLTQLQMAEVFQTSTDNVSLHLKNIYATDELEEAATTEDFSVVRSEGQRRVRRKGQWSIRINDQRRICFKWPEGSSGPTEVEIVDYH